MTIRELGEKLKGPVWFDGFHEKIDALVAVAEAADEWERAQSGDPRVAAYQKLEKRICALRAALEDEHEHQWVIPGSERLVAFCMNCPARVELPRRGKVGA